MKSLYVRSAHITTLVTLLSACASLPSPPTDAPTHTEAWFKVTQRCASAPLERPSTLGERSGRLSQAGEVEGEGEEGEPEGETRRARLEALALMGADELWREAPLLEDWRAALRAHPPLPHALKERLSSTEGWHKVLTSALLPSLWLSVDVLSASGVPLSALLPPLLRLDLTSERALLWMKAAPEWSPLSHISLSPERVLQEWREAGWSPLKEGSVGVLLDEQRILYVSGRGEGVRLVQEVLRVNNKRGVEALGEVELPPQATLLSLYTLKPSGARLAPVMIPEKEGYSLQDLQVGDFMVARYLEPLSALRRSGGALTPRLPLQEPDRAVWRRLYHVWRAADAQPLEVLLHHVTPSVEEQRLGEGEDPSLLRLKRPTLTLKRAEWEGGALLSAEVRALAPSSLEPASLSGAGLATLEVGRALNEAREWGALLAVLRERVALSEQERAELAAWALSPSRLGVRLWESVREDAPLLESPSALETLQRGVGSRALLLWSALSALGERCELALARPPQPKDSWRWRASPAPEQDRALEPASPWSLNIGEEQAALLVRCEPQSEPQSEPQKSTTRAVFYDPSLYLSPRGVSSVSVRGGELITLWPPAEGLACDELSGDEPRASQLTTRALPWWSPTLSDQGEEVAQERHELTLSMWLDPYGARGLLGALPLRAHVEHSLSGEEGALMFGRLERASGEERRRWLERQWSAWLGASEVSALRSVWSESEGLALSYELKVSARLPLSLNLSPQAWGQRFAALNVRRHGLRLPPIEQRLRLELIAPPDQPLTTQRPITQRLQLEGEARSLSWASEPQGGAGELETKAERSEASFTRAVSPTSLEVCWRMSGGLISPQRYGSWASFSREVERLEAGVQLIVSDQEPVRAP